MKRLLITGASGFLGGHIYTLAKSSWQVMAVYYNHPPQQLTKEWMRLDLTDQHEILKSIARFQPDVIIHAAANSNLDQCEQNPEMARQVNVESTRILYNAARSLNSRFLFVSSDMVFDGRQGNYRETDPVCPISVYGRTKVDSEQLFLSKEGNFVIARSALIYGRPVIGGSSFSMWIENRLRMSQNTPLFVDQYRTPVLVNNLAAALLELAENDFTGIIHLGGENRINRLTFGKQLCAVCNYDEGLLQTVSMHDNKSAAPRPVDVSLHTGLARATLHTPLLNTAEGLKLMCGL